MQTDLLTLPLWLHRGTAFVTFAFAIFMIAANAAIAAMAAQRTVDENQNCRPVPRRRIPRVMVRDRDYCWRWIEFPYSARTAPAH
jgi:hypothetical protein